MGIEGRADIQYRYYYILLFLVFMEALFFLYYGLSRHNNYLSSSNDLGHYDHIIWCFSEGGPFRYAGEHFEPVLAVFVPFYFIMPSVNWLILAQSLALPFASLPIYFLALNITQSGATALMWAAIYLINPFVLSAASNDFHPVFLAVPFISLAYLALEEKKSVKLFLSCIFILLCKEHFGLLVMGFGVLWYLKNRGLKTSLSLLIMGGSYFLLVMKVLIPFFSTSDEHFMIVGQASRYGWLGQSLENIFIRIFTDSAEIIRYVLFTLGGGEYLLLLVLPLMFLPLLGCMFLLPGISDLLANLLSANPRPLSVR